MSQAKVVRGAKGRFEKVTEKAEPNVAEKAVSGMRRLEREDEARREAEKVMEENSEPRPFQEIAESAARIASFAIQLEQRFVSAGLIDTADLNNELNSDDEGCVVDEDVKEPIDVSRDALLSHVLRSYNCRHTVQAGTPLHVVTDLLIPSFNLLNFVVGEALVTLTDGEYRVEQRGNVCDYPQAFTIRNIENILNNVFNNLTCNLDLLDSNVFLANNEPCGNGMDNVSSSNLVEHLNAGVVLSNNILNRIDALDANLYTNFGV